LSFLKRFFALLGFFYFSKLRVCNDGLPICLGLIVALMGQQEYKEIVRSGTIGRFPVPKDIQAVAGQDIRGLVTEPRFHHWQLPRHVVIYPELEQPTAVSSNLLKVTETNRNQRPSRKRYRCNRERC